MKSTLTLLLLSLSMNFALLSSGVSYIGALIASALLGVTWGVAEAMRDKKNE